MGPDGLGASSRLGSLAVRRFRLLAPVVVVTVTLAGCGGGNRSSDSSAPPTSRPTSAGDTTSADTTTSSPTPAGCSQFCAQAGPVGGDSPRDATQVLHCTSSCITQITKSADV